jgi:hypothetical protein
VTLQDDQQRQRQVVRWITTLQQLCAEHAAAVQVIKAAGKVMAAAKPLAPRAARQPAHELQVRAGCVGCF